MASMIIRIWRALTQPFAVAKAVAACRKGDAELAKKYYSQFEESNQPRYVGLGGQIRLMERDYDGARRYFEKAARAVSQGRNKSDRYVWEYCSFYLSLLKNDGMHEQHLDAAFSLKPPGFLFRMLPLAPKDWQQPQDVSAPNPSINFKYAPSKPDYSLEASVNFKSEDH
jgi:tetratricopeptide (TPR) repeat protein